MSLDCCLARKRLREWMNIIRSLVMKSITSENSRISEADSIVAVQKEEGGLGEGTTYEVAFAKFIGKKVFIF